MGRDNKEPTYPPQIIITSCPAVVVVGKWWARGVLIGRLRVLSATCGKLVLLIASSNTHTLIHKYIWMHIKYTQIEVRMVANWTLKAMSL